MLFLMKKMLLRSGVTTIFDTYLNFFKFRAINILKRFFVKTRGHCWVGKICHWCLEKCSNYGKHWLKMAHLVHIALFNNSKNNKMHARVGKTTTFVVKLDFLNFVPLMKIDDSFCQKSLLLARCVEFVTFAFKKAPVMENIV